MPEYEANWLSYRTQLMKQYIHGWRRPVNDIGF